MKIVEMYHRKYVICDEFQNDSGCYTRIIAENYPNHLDFVEKEDEYGHKCKYRFVRHAFLELGKEVNLEEERNERVF